MTGSHDTPVKRTWWTDFIVDKPCVVICSTLLIALTLSTIPFVSYEFVLSSGGNFYPRDSPVMQLNDALDSVRRDQERGEDLNPLPQSALFQNELYFYIPRDDNVLTIEHFEAIYDIEKQLASVEGYEDYCWKVYGANDTLIGCVDPGSPVALPFWSFFPDGKFNGTQADFDAGLTTAASIVDDDPQIGFFFDRKFASDHLESTVTRSIFFYGAPLAGYANLATPTAREEQMSKYYEWSLVQVDVLQKMRTKYDSLMEILPLGGGVMEYEITEVVNSDLTLFGLAVTVVMVIATIQTWSFFLGFISIIHIVLSFPMAYFVYRVVLNLQVFTQFNLMSLFVVLAIGADDVFVLVDAFKQSFQEGPEVNKSLHTRFAWSYQRAVKAMFVTSFTTFMAFVATAISPIPSIRALGLFTAATVLFNYLMVISWYAAIIVVWYRWNCYGTHKFRDEEAAKVTQSPAQTRRRSLSRQSSVTLDRFQGYRKIERFFHATYSPFVAKHSLPILAVSLVFLGVFIGMASQAQPIQKDLSFWGDDFFLSRTQNLMSNVFRKTDEQPKPIISLVWGIAGIDNSGLDINDDFELGKPVLDTKFDLSPPAAQLSARATCDEARVSPHTYEGQVKCPMETFAQWLGNTTGTPSWPVADATDFRNAIGQWLADDTTTYGGNLDPVLFPERNFVNDVVLDDDGNVEMMFVSVNSTMDVVPTIKVMRVHFDHWDKLIKERNSDSDTPDSVSRAYQASPQLWSTLLTADVLVESVIIGIIASLALSYGVLLLSTGNLIVSTFALLTISSIVVTMVGMIVAFGWTMGFTETVSLVILVGLAVDYVVHLAVAYVNCELIGDDDKQSRHLRVQAALTELGVSVSGGAATTIGTTLFLVPTQLLLLQRFGIIIAVSTAVSFCFALMTFMALLARWGPVGDAGDLHAWARGKFGKTVDPAPNA